MKSKSSLLLMEQLIMVLVFALAAALCLQVFAKSAEIARQTACQDAAVQIARNAAETYKQGSDPAALETEHFSLEITESLSQIKGFEGVNIAVSCPCGVEFHLAAGRQEVAP